MIKITFLSKLMYKFNEFKLELELDKFELDKLIQKFMWKNKQTRIIRKTLWEKKKSSAYQKLKHNIESQWLQQCILNDWKTKGIEKKV